jgi:hypothetical protein
VDNELEIAAGQRMEPVSYPDTPVPIIWIGCSRRRRPTRSASALSVPCAESSSTACSIIGKAHLRAVLAEYQANYNTARPHQGIGQRVPDGEHDGSRLAVCDLDHERISRNPSLTA